MGVLSYCFWPRVDSKTFIPINRVVLFSNCKRESTFPNGYKRLPFIHIHSADSQVKSFSRLVCWRTKCVSEVVFWQFYPVFLFPLFFGWWRDRHNKKKSLIIITFQSSRGSSYFGVFVGGQNVSHTNEACRFSSWNTHCQQAGDVDYCLTAISNLATLLKHKSKFMPSKPNLSVALILQWYLHSNPSSWLSLYSSPQWSDNNSTHVQHWKKKLLSVLKVVIDSLPYIAKKGFR